MLLFVILAPMSGSPVVQMRHHKNCRKILDQKTLDPFLLIQMAKSLYIIGTELQSGGLKELDLTHYSLVTHLDGDYLLILGVVDHSKHKKKLALIKDVMGDLHAELLQVTKQSETPEPIPIKDVIRILTNADLKKESKHLIPFD